MNGAEALIATALENGIEVCFANPGTTEMPLVGALDSVPGIRAVLCLHENVATGASDGYARMAGKPAMTILHLGPGLGNGLTNLHNARRARTPIVNLVGDHASWHLKADPPLTTEIDLIAKAVSGWFKSSMGADSLAGDMAEAIAASQSQGGQVATLVVPHDAQWSETAKLNAQAQPPGAAPVSHDTVQAAASALKGGKTALYMGGTALGEAALLLCGRIAEATGADMICETFFARMERGGGLPTPVKLPYFPEQALAVLEAYDKVVMVEANPPVAFFGYPDGASFLTRDEQNIILSGPGDDTPGALEALAGAVGAPDSLPRAKGEVPPMPSGALSADVIAGVIANLQPEDAIIMDEGLTSSAAYHEATNFAPRFTHLQLTGGAIGIGPGAATGAAIACPGRQVINLQADGSAAYSLQALWTQARENLNVITVLCSNRSYNILGFELHRAGIMQPGPSAQSLCSLDNPAINWVTLAEGFGVPGVSVDTAEALGSAFERALERDGPSLIEVQMP